MSESQSRYSIVERLTKQKLNIMRKKHELNDHIKKTEYEFQLASESIEDEKQQIDEDVKRQKADLDRTLEKKKKIAEYAKERKDGEEQVFDEQIKAIDSALKQIEDIGTKHNN